MDDLSKSSLALLVVGVLVVSIAGTLLVLNAIDAAAGVAVSTAQGIVSVFVVGGPSNAAPAVGAGSAAGTVGVVVK